jgi:predicted transcriptional regulator
MKAEAKPKLTPAQAYDAWYDEQVRLGLEDIDAGRVVTHEQYKKHMDAFMNKLAKKHGREVA